MVSKRDAARLENELANILWERGFAVVRGPSSGSGARRRFQPDLIAARDGIIIVVEVKRARPGQQLYVPSRQVEGLLELERRSGGVAVIATRIPWEGWRFHFLRDLPRTPSGMARIDRPETGMRLRDLEEELFQKSKRLTEYMDEG